MNQLGRFTARHPRLVTWLVLAIGLIGIVLLTTGQVVMSWAQRAALVAIIALFAAPCAWIIHWE